jgi:predicted O-methyltransferase YrrM
MQKKPKPYGLKQQIQTYLQFRLSAKSWRSVHSPYIFKLGQHLKTSTFNSLNFQVVEKLRSSLKSNKTIVTFPDFGAEGKVVKRTISNIVRTSAKRKSQCRLLSQIIEYVNPEVVLELGTNLGISYAYMALAAPNATITTIEGAPELAEIASTNLSELGIFGNIKVGEFESKLPQVLRELETIDFAFVDGNHQESNTLDYFNQLVTCISQDGCIVFDDIYWSEGMTTAWKSIQSDPRVTLSVDCYHFGLVFIKSGVGKQHFKLRL